MSDKTNSREGFSSKFGVIAAAAGLAVGFSPFKQLGCFDNCLDL